MFSFKKIGVKRKVIAILFLLQFSVEAHADIYMDLDARFQSLAQLLGSGEENERYLVMNGVPVRTNIYLSKQTPEEIVETVYKHKYQDIISSRALTNDVNEPIVVSNRNIATILSINLNELLKNNDGQDKQSTASNTYEENYVVMASKINNKFSRVFELKFNSIFDIAKLLIDNGSDVECNEKLNVDRYPASRRIFCLTEITSDLIKSQTIIYEGLGDTLARSKHYENELDTINFKIDGAKNGTESKNSILFASNENSQVTIFTYLSDNKTLDIIQSKF